MPDKQKLDPLAPLFALKKVNRMLRISPGTLSPKKVGINSSTQFARGGGVLATWTIIPAKVHTSMCMHATHTHHK